MAVGVGCPSPNTAPHTVGTWPISDKRGDSLLGRWFSLLPALRGLGEEKGWG